MSSQSLPVSMTGVRETTQERATMRTSSVRIVVAVFIALLILFGWLRLILALNIASTGRQIQVQTEELKMIERANDELRRGIAQELSPTRLATEAYNAGFKPGNPIYVPLPQPVGGAPESYVIPATDSSITAGEEPTELGDESLWDLASQELDTLLQTVSSPGD